MVIKKKDLEEKLKIHTLKEVADYYNVNYFTLCRKCKQHGIKVNRKVGKKIFILNDDKGDKNEEITENKN